MTDPADIVAQFQREPLLLPWPADGNPGGFLSFETGAQWRDFIAGLGIDPHIPDIVQAKFDRAQRLYLLGWIDFNLIKAGELAALIALELALMDRYGGAISKRKRSFSTLLLHMVQADGLTDAQIPMSVRCGGSALGQLTGETHPTLAERRNLLAHGDPFDGFPTGGLLELVRDLINYAYRGYIAEAAAFGRRA
ncbi:MULTISPECIES: hypothetical protein [unclassified Sphingomonas]|uniref:hypothetical protein n=1 Tax=Sphingomonas TaxID=13687 RepID=UPI00095956FC|nr:MULTISPECIES: hypothetical protein [unclassified Sphingomonas]MBN8812376.1 hypothetical protein [Sphingomonas sp.]OJY48066.1 MAG: hypothetical protein BGP17_02655 [Sphingomonas sp. 67-41]